MDGGLALSESSTGNSQNTLASESGPKLHALLAEFESTAALKSAAAQVRDAGYTSWDVHSPFPVHGIDPAIGIKPTRLPWLVLVCGAIGCLAGLALQWWTNAADPADYGVLPTFLQGYHFQISGKPFFSLPANIPVIFELTVLFAALGAGLGMLASNDLPVFHRPLFASKKFARATTDALLIRIDAADPAFDETKARALLESIGGRGVEAVYDTNCDGKPPRYLARAGVILACAALIPLAIIAMARNARSDHPPIHIVQDMDNQERFEAQQAHSLFRDGRAMRPQESGTVARGQLRLDDHYYRGLVDGDFAAAFPGDQTGIVLTEAFLRRGQQRFNIYCATCHGRDGAGNGMVNKRATELGPWTPAANLHEDQYRERPVGHIFNTITNGIRSMPGYAEQIDVSDRWAIVAYLRALQRASQGSIAELPPEVREELEAR